MKKLSLLLIILCMSSMLFAQKDTVSVLGYFESNYTYGTLNDAIQTAVDAGTISNTVFKLTPYEQYVLTAAIFLDHGQDLDIYAPKAGTTQETAPPQILWTEDNAVTRTYMIQSYGDITIQNVWLRFTDTQGAKMQTGIVFEDQDAEAEPEIGSFEGCLFDYFEIGCESGGAVTVKADHFEGYFTDCYFRNGNDPHFQYYGRAVSFPYQSTGWHYDSLIFENCSFTNLSRLVMQEGNEYGSNIQINHCTVLNTIEWVWQSAGWLEQASVTNSIFINPYMLGYRGIDVCELDQDFDDFEDGKCDTPGGGLLNGITAVDSFAFEVPFTDYDRKLYIGYDAYLYQDWMLDWFSNCGWCKDQHKARNDIEMRQPSPMLGSELDFIDSTDTEGNKVFANLNVDWATIYDADPGFIVAPTNLDTIKQFIEFKWSTAADINWAYMPNVAFAQKWPLPENMAYTNTTYQTAAMGGFPLGDLNWFPTEKANWEAQRDAEWIEIGKLLNRGVAVDVKENIVSNFNLNQNYPNPFNPTTNISFTLNASEHVNLVIYDVMGRAIETLADGTMNAGAHELVWNAENYASGVYFFKLSCGDMTKVRKMTLQK